MYYHTDTNLYNECSVWTDLKNRHGGICWPYILSLVSVFISILTVFNNKYPKLNKNGQFEKDCRGNIIYRHIRFEMKILHVVVSMVYLMIMNRICASYKTEEGSEYKGIRWKSWLWLLFGVNVLYMAILMVVLMVLG